jgi:hypothetical protein
MSSYLDRYFSLNDTERSIVRTAAMSGDSPLTRQMLQLYFPKLSPEEITALMGDLRAFPRT